MAGINYSRILVVMLMALVMASVASAVAPNGACPPGGDPQCPPPSVTIIASKIVCDNEADLPNWGLGGPDITSTTASDFLANHPNCAPANGWRFQWGYANVSNPGDNTGEAPESTGWYTSHPTEPDGMTTMSMFVPNGESMLKVREVLKPGFIDFAYDAYGNNNDTSAEIYCHTDVLNYDNYDWITSPLAGQTYYCVAWNVHKAYCGDGEVNQESEECDGGDYCHEDCTWMDYCGDGQIQNPNDFQQNEECDDNNTVNGDGCSNECTIEEYCGDGVVNQETEQCDDGNNIDGDGCSANCALEPVTIIANKIVCIDEMYLPNWGAGGPDMTATTASDFLAQHEKVCWLAPWSFQWAQAGVSNPGDNTGEAGAGWTTFTGVSGTATATINEVTGDRIWVREVWQEGYIPFTGQNTVEDVSAELYCYEDSLNYDNYDYIMSPQLGTTYYCVAWNVREEEEPEPCDPQVEMIANGGFEMPVVNHSAKWYIYPSGTPDLNWIVEWQTSEPNYGGYDRPEVANLELHRGVNGWLSAEGEQHSELDSDWFGPDNGQSGEPASVRIYQDLATVPGRDYTLKLQFSPRPSTGAEENVLEVKVGGVVMDTVSAAGGSNTAWSAYEYNFTAESEVTRVQLTDMGISNSLGTFVDGVSVRCFVDEEPVGYCGDGIVNSETEECDDGNQIEGDGCNSNCMIEKVTIVVNKIMCENEADLPNWGDGTHTINEATASDFLAQHPKVCWLEPDWYFQWADYNVVGFPADNSGEADPSTGWTTFGPTNGSGYASLTVQLGEIQNIGVREVPQEGYIPFSLDAGNDVSAEFYCHVDAYLYDNREVIGKLYEEQGLVPGMTYYCVGWNVPVEQEPRPYCGDGIQQDNEECDDGNTQDGDGCSSQCVEETQPPGCPGCTNGAGAPGGESLWGGVLSITGGSLGGGLGPQSGITGGTGNGEEEGEGEEEQMQPPTFDQPPVLPSGGNGYIGLLEENEGAGAPEEPNQPSPWTAFLVGGSVPQDALWAVLAALLGIPLILFFFWKRRKEEEEQ